MARTRSQCTSLGMMSLVTLSGSDIKVIYAYWKGLYQWTRFWIQRYMLLHLKGNPGIYIKTGRVVVFIGLYIWCFGRPWINMLVFTCTSAENRYKC